MIFITGGHQLLKGWEDITEAPTFPYENTWSGRQPYQQGLGPVHYILLAWMPILTAINNIAFHYRNVTG